MTNSGAEGGANPFGTSELDERPEPSGGEVTGLVDQLIASTADDAPEPAPAPAPVSVPEPEPAVVEPVVRQRSLETRKRKRRITGTQAAVTVIFLALIGGLVFAGYKVSLRISGGSAERITDGEAPGYVANTRLSTVDLFLVTDSEGALASALLVVPDSSGSGGTAVPLPPTLVLPGIGDQVPVFITDLFKVGGVDAVKDRVSQALTFGIESAEVVSQEAFTDLADGERVVIDNIDNLIVQDEAGTQSLAYSAGELTLQPEEVADFLAFSGIDDPAPNQALRAQAVWEQLFARNQGEDMSGLPEGEPSAESETGLFGTSLTAMLGGEYRFDQLPVEKQAVPDSYFFAWIPSTESLNSFVARVVPMPSSPIPGMRQPVVLLNGTDDSSVLGPAANKVVLAGGEVTLVGNADSSDVETTEVFFLGDDSAAQAEAVAGEFGVTAQQSGDMPEGVSIKVVLGADSIAAPAPDGNG